LISQRQQHITSQVSQRLAYQQRIYIDSPAWKRQQRMKPLDTIVELKKTIDVDSGFGKWETDVSTAGHSDALDSPAAVRRHSSSQSNKIFIVSDNHPNEPPENTCEPESSSLY
jgi:hypothetical protein